MIPEVGIASTGTFDPALEDTLAVTWSRAFCGSGLLVPRLPADGTQIELVEVRTR